jgi:hypothetical protein
LRVGRDNAEAFLVGEYLIAQLFVTHVELAFELVDPLLLRLVRRMGAPGYVIKEERLVGRGRVQVAQMFDGLVGQIGGEVVAGLADKREYLGMVTEQVRRPLVGLPAHKAVEILETQSRGPLIVRPGNAVLKTRRVVVLAKPGGGVTALLQDCADGGILNTDDGIVAWITGRQFADDAGSDRVMIAARNQRRPRRRTKRSGVELDVAQSRAGNAIQRRCWDNTAKGARDAVALVIGHDQEHVGEHPWVEPRAEATNVSNPWRFP